MQNRSTAHTSPSCFTATVWEILERIALCRATCPSRFHKREQHLTKEGEPSLGEGSIFAATRPAAQRDAGRDIEREAPVLSSARFVCAGRTRYATNERDVPATYGKLLAWVTKCLDWPMAGYQMMESRMEFVGRYVQHGDVRLVSLSLSQSVNIGCSLLLRDMQPIRTSIVGS